MASRKHKITISVRLETTFLTQEDCDQLTEWGYKVCDLDQIDRAASACTYKEYNPEEYGNDREHRISRKRAIELIGREEFLSGLSRAAFHASSCRNYGDPIDAKGLPFVYFDLNKWWK